MATREFRFGAVSASPGTAADWADRARALEDAGYAIMLVPDTLDTPSPLLALAAAAARTSSLHLGTWVLSAPLRHPAELAREVRTVQQLSSGRFELGLGAGRPGGERDAAALGAPWGAPGERVDRVLATLEAVRAEVDPVPRLVVAAAGERMLGIAGRLADTVALPAPPTATMNEIAVLAERARTFGRDDLELSVQVTGVGDDIPVWLRSRLGLTPDDQRERGVPTLLSGDAERDADSLRDLRDRTGISYLTVPGDFTSVLAPLVARLAGG